MEFICTVDNLIISYQALCMVNFKQPSELCSLRFRLEQVSEHLNGLESHFLITVLW